MSTNPHFATAESWDAAEQMVTFTPRRPSFTAGHQLGSLSVYVMDHKRRELSAGQRSLEAHYGAFVVSQSRPGAGKARRQALSVAYGADAIDARVAGHPARLYELGPEVPPDDIDGRAPAVVVWHEGDRFFLVASTELEAEILMDIAGSMYPLPHQEPGA